MGKMHAAKRLTSRLYRMLMYLKDVGDRGATTRDIIINADVCAVNSIAAELKTQGYRIECKRESKSVFRYKLIES